MTSVSFWHLDSSKVHWKYLERFEIRYCRRMGRIVWSDSVKREEVLCSAKDERSIPHTIKRTKKNRNDHMLRRNCLLKSVIEGKKEGICFGRGY